MARWSCAGRVAVVTAVGAIGPWVVGATLAFLTSVPSSSMPLAPPPLHSDWMMAHLPTSWKADAFIGAPMAVRDQFGSSGMVCSGYWQAFDEDPDATCTAEFFVVKAGWPFRCVIGAAAAIGFGVGSDFQCPHAIVGLDSLVVFDSNRPGQYPIDRARLVPVAVLASGYLMNGVIYAAAAIALWTPGLVVRRRKCVQG